MANTMQKKRDFIRPLMQHSETYQIRQCLNRLFTSRTGLGALQEYRYLLTRSLPTQDMLLNSDYRR